MTRKEFNRIAAIITSGIAFPILAHSFPEKKWTSLRPEPSERKFKSKAVDNLIDEIKAHCKDPELAWLFENCFPNTLDTTAFFEIKNGLPDTYIITGDIDAMWLRDSSAQVHPYIPLCSLDKDLSLLIEGLIRRQTKYILLDPYANAFYKDATKKSQWQHDKTEMRLGVHERKWELDSLCYCIRLAYHYWKQTTNQSMFDATWMDAMQLVVHTMKVQQRKENKGDYHFQRKTFSKTDTQSNHGYGKPCKPNGMICSAFRNSDDATTYLYNIPENLFAVAALRQLAEITESIQPNSSFSKECLELSNEVEATVLEHGIVTNQTFGEIYAYETDGFGNYLNMEDAGIPGLVTIPYLGYGSYLDSIYQRSRKFALSADNPYFYSSNIAEGNGSPHTEYRGKMIWPIGIIARALTTSDETEITKCLTMLKTTHAGKGFMHESFQKDNPNNFTRHWFAWANSLFGEMICKVYREKPHLL